jgi:hypothetical protein
MSDVIDERQQQTTFLSLNKLVLVNWLDKSRVKFYNLMQKLLYISLVKLRFGGKINCFKVIKYLKFFQNHLRMDWRPFLKVWMQIQACYLLAELANVQHPVGALVNLATRCTHVYHFKSHSPIRKVKWIHFCFETVILDVLNYWFLGWQSKRNLLNKYWYLATRKKEKTA